MLLNQDLQLNARIFFFANGNERSERLFAIHEPLLVPITDSLTQQCFKAGIVNDDSQLLAGSLKTLSATLLQNKVQQEGPAGLSRTISFWLFPSRSTTHFKLMSLGQTRAINATCASFITH
jgi:hypothetical protein